MSSGLERGDGPHDHPVADVFCHSICCFVLFCVIFFPRCCGSSKPHFSKGVPGFWDKTAIPDSGFQVLLFVMFLVISPSSLLTNKTDVVYLQRVLLPPSHRDYVRVHERFSETLRGFTVRQIERVQNRELWEDFMMWVLV